VVFFEYFCCFDVWNVVVSLCRVLLLFVIIIIIIVVVFDFVSFVCLFVCWLLFRKRFRRGREVGLFLPCLVGVSWLFGWRWTVFVCFLRLMVECCMILFCVLFLFVFGVLL